MDGKCDVPQCKQQTYLGWRPLFQKNGYQICKPHFEKHKSDREYLYRAFNIKKPRLSIKSKGKNEIIQLRTETEKDEQWTDELLPQRDTTLRECPDCHKPKLRPRQRFCDNCKKKRRLKTKREYQYKFRRKQNICA